MEAPIPADFGLLSFNVTATNAAGAVTNTLQGVPAIWKFHHRRHRLSQTGTLAGIPLPPGLTFQDNGDGTATISGLDLVLCEVGDL